MSIIFSGEIIECPRYLNVALVYLRVTFLEGFCIEYFNGDKNMYGNSNRLSYILGNESAFTSLENYATVTVLAKRVEKLH